MKSTIKTNQQQVDTIISRPILSPSECVASASNVILQRLSLICKEVVELQEDIEGLQLHLQQREDLAIHQDRTIATLELELDRIVERGPVHNPLWPTLKSKFPRLLHALSLGSQKMLAESTI